MARLQHPFMAAVHPWLMWMGIGFFGIGVAIALWKAFVDDELVRSPFVLIAFGLICWLGAQALDPVLDGDERWKAITLLAFVTFGIFALCEWLANWEFTPFRYLMCAPIAVDLGRMAMRVPAHVKSGAEQVVVLLNQLPDPAKNALIIGAAVVSFLAACVKLVKNLTA